MARVKQEGLGGRLIKGKGKITPDSSDSLRIIMVLGDSTCSKIKYMDVNLIIKIVAHYKRGNSYA